MLENIPSKNEQQQQKKIFSFVFLSGKE